MSLNIRVKSNKIDKYFHDGKYYVEGRKNSTYEIEYTNNTIKRQKVVFSVDGLNVISGNNDWTKGYVVNAGETVVIPGWRKDENNVAKFQFSSVKGSYNQHNDSGDEMNVGVIGALVYDEKYVAPEVKVIHHNHYHNNWPQYQYWPYYQPYITYSNINTVGDFGGNISNQLYSGAIGGGSNSCDAGASVNNVNVGGVTPQASLSRSMMDIADKPRSASKSKGFNLCSDDSRGIVPQNSVQQEVGTGWGGNQYFKTSTTTFYAEDKPSKTLTIYYDSRKNLERMGVVLKPIKERQPEAFPGLTARCPAPK